MRPRERSNVYTPLRLEKRGHGASRDGMRPTISGRSVSCATAFIGSDRKPARRSKEKRLQRCGVRAFHLIAQMIKPTTEYPAGHHPPKFRTCRRKLQGEIIEDCCPGTTRPQMPFSLAHIAACVRFCALSLRSTFLTWIFTVASARSKLRAMILFDSPTESPRRTSDLTGRQIVKSLPIRP